MLFILFCDLIEIAAASKCPDKLKQCVHALLKFIVMLQFEEEHLEVCACVCSGGINVMF